jgi:hypothetical protein
MALSTIDDYVVVLNKKSDSNHGHPGKIVSGSLESGVLEIKFLNGEQKRFTYRPQYPERHLELFYRHNDIVGHLLDHNQKAGPRGAVDFCESLGISRKKVYTEYQKLYGERLTWR